MQGVDIHRICVFVFAGSKKCTRNSTDCLLCLRVLKKIPVMLVERVLCLRVQKNAPAMVLHVVILSVAKDLAGCTNILWFGDLEILEFLDLAPPRHNKYTYSALGLIATFTSFRMTVHSKTARSAKNWAVVLLSRRPSHNGHKQLLTFYTIKSLSLYLPSGRAHIALRLLRWVKIRLLLTF